METGTDFIFLGSKNTLDSDCSQEIKTLVLWKKSYDKPKQCIKSRDITWPTKICIVKAMVFPVVMYACESWTVKKAERQIIDAFELWCWKRLLGVPWTARRSNQSIQKEISPEYSLEGLMLKLKLQYFWPPAVKSWLIGKRSWCWGSLRARGEGDDRGQDGLMVSLTQWTWVWASFRRWWRTGKPGMLQSMGLQRVRYNWTTEQQHFRFHCVFIALHRLFSSCNEQGLLSLKPSLVPSRLSSADSSHLVLPRLPTSVFSFIRLCLDFSSLLWNLDMLTEVSWE